LSKRKQRALDRAFIKYNVVSEQPETQQTVRASWVQSYNPINPIRDDNASTRNLGIFIIVSNGPPGEDITIDLDCKYDIYFCGPAPRSVAIDNSLRATMVPSGLNNYFQTITTRTGPGAFTNPNLQSYTLPAGQYFITQTYIGSGITAAPAKTITSGCTISTFTSVGGGTVLGESFYINAPKPCTISLGNLPASTFTSWILNVAMSTGNV